MIQTAKTPWGGVVDIMLEGTSERQFTAHDAEALPHHTASQFHPSRKDLQGGEGVTTTQETLIGVSSTPQPSCRSSWLYIFHQGLLLNPILM